MTPDRATAKLATCLAILGLGLILGLAFAVHGTRHGEGPRVAPSVTPSGSDLGLYFER